MNIIEIWGNSLDVIIKYKKEGLNNIWYKASNWKRNNSNMNDNWLIKNGYRKIKFNENDIKEWKGRK